MTIRNFLDQVETNRNLDFQNQPENLLGADVQEDDEIFTEEKIETIIGKFFIIKHKKMLKLTNSRKYPQLYNDHHSL